MVAAATLCAAQSVLAQPSVQTIDRVKITDNDLTCAQIHAEVTEMDTIVARYNAADAQAGNTGDSEIATGMVVDIFGRMLGIFGGTLGQIFGGVATQAATRGVKEVNKEDNQRTLEHRRQAEARKSYLTTMFVNRGCRTSDLTYNPPLQSPAAPAPAAAESVAPQPYLAPPYTSPQQP
jgi:hypothetical protein